jgi:hypothetical protein
MISITAKQPSKMGHHEAFLVMTHFFEAGVG